MISRIRGLIEYADRYLLSRDVSTAYADSVRRGVSSFCRFAECDLSIDALNCDLANEWLATLKGCARSAHTIDGYRRVLLAVWNDAYQNGDNDNPPLRLKRIKKPLPKVTAFTHDEIRALLATAARLPGRHPNGNKAADWWVAAIHVGYSTGLRRGDVLALRMSDIEPDFRATVIQHKTGYGVTVRLSAAAMKAVGWLTRTADVALPWPYSRNVVARQFKRLVKAAGVRPGTFRWLRRSAGSYAEREQRGNGTAALGHRCEKVFRNSYEDRSITQSEPVSPPEL